MTAMHCVVLIVLTFTTLQTRSFRVFWNAREASYLYLYLKYKLIAFCIVNTVIKIQNTL